MTDFEDDPSQGDEFDEETRAVDPAAEGFGAESPQQDQAYLIVISGSRVGAMVKVAGGMTIGRASKADFRTPDDGVSRTHVRIEEDPEGGLVAVDLGSRNGTFVNGSRVGRVRLQDGDKIRIGSTTILKFSYADKLEESFQQQMYNAALRDPLTQVYNRRHFDEQLAAEFAYASRHRFPLSLIIMDLDHFKRVNDTHGHLAGDSVLVGLADILISSTRKEDIFARYGGEEFGLLCRGIRGPVAYTIADRIRHKVQHAILVPEVPELKVTLSAGVAALPDPSIGSPEDLIQAADSALYRAKETGRNRVFLYDPDMASGGEADDSVPTGESVTPTPAPDDPADQ